METKLIATLDLNNIKTLNGMPCSNKTLTELKKDLIVVVERNMQYVIVGIWFVEKFPICI